MGTPAVVEEPAREGVERQGGVAVDQAAKGDDVTQRVVGPTTSTAAPVSIVSDDEEADCDADLDNDSGTNEDVVVDKKETGTEEDEEEEKEDEEEEDDDDADDEEDTDDAEDAVVTPLPLLYG